MEQAQFYGGLRSLGKKNLEWNLNDWQWDGDLFIASPQVPASAQSGFRGQQVVPVPVAGQSSNSSSSISDDLRAEPEIARWQARDLDRKRRVIAVDNDNDNDGEDESGSLSLKLGGFSSSGGQSQGGIEVNVDGSGGKKTKLTGSPPNRSVCQVENCGVDLSSAKDYHRRHKVCEMHSKASRALVGNVMQRFCQQCSRFHHLQEFDEGKRSCRRRLAGHNKRRRKTLPEPVVGSQPVNNEQASNYILASLLKSLSNVHTDNRTDPSTDHDLVARLVRSLASQPGPQNVNDVSGMLHEYQRKFLNGKISVGNSEKVSQPSAPPSRPPKPTDQCHSMPASVMPQERQASSQKSDIVLSKDGLPVFSEVRNSAEAQTKFNFDLNDVYVDLEDGVEDPERSPVTVTGAFRTGSLGCPSWAQQDSQQSSPPHVSGNSDSASAHSLSSSSGEAQSQSGRIVFKLFGKEPNDFPVMLRGQILDWLAHSPTDLESYIRPGCVILTIYLRLREPLWEELCSNFGFSLSRLLDITDDSFWGTGWLYARVQNQIAFCHNGQLVINTSLPSEIRYCSRILSVSPIAVSMSELAQFQIKGFNLSRPSTRLICALDGKYLALEETHLDLTADDDNSMDNDEIKCVNLSCFIPSVAGRGFIEVEDDGLTSSFFPFIVAENDVCSEIRTLESLLESGDSNEANKKLDAKHQAMDFLHEMGWLLHRCQLKTRLTNQNLNTSAFSFKRFTCILEFSMDHDWCAVVKKLLDIFLQGMVDAGEHPSQDVAISAMGLLHRAVRRNSRSLVELLLHYSPLKLSEEFGCEQKLPSGEDGQNFLFRPDAKGPGGLTPLHIAAGKDGSEAVLEALIDDPGKVGLEAWKNARDSTGSTPEDYARLRGHYAYIHLVQRKMSRQPSTGSVVVDMPNDINSPNTSKRTTDGISGFELAMLASRNVGPSCNRCERKMAYGSVGRSLVYRPVMLSMVGIAAVCVCVALLFRGLPDVDCIFRPFRWESLDYGSI